MLDHVILNMLGIMYMETNKMHRTIKEKCDKNTQVHASDKKNKQNITKYEISSKRYTA